MVTRRTHARCSQVNSLLGKCACSFCDRISLCRVGSANGNHFGFQLATRFRKPTLRNGYTWVMIPQVTSGSNAWLIFLRWYIILNTKIVPPNINDLRKHLQHRDQLGSLMLLPGNFLDPRVLHPSGKERRHHRLSQDQSSSVLFLNVWRDPVGLRGCDLLQRRPVHYVGKDRP